MSFSRPSRTDMVLLIRRHRAPQWVAADHHSLRLCLGKGTFRRARVGRVRSLDLLSILLPVFSTPDTNVSIGRHNVSIGKHIESFVSLLWGPAQDDHGHTKQGDSGSGPVKD